MTMGEESPVAVLVLPVLVKPVLDKVERRNAQAAQTLKSAIAKVDTTHPGFLYDLVMGIVRRGDLSVNMTESLLKLQGSTPELPSSMDNTRGAIPEGYQELNRKSQALKRILSRIPDEINDRKTFLETIKEIASAIKKLLDAVNDVSLYISSLSGRQALDQRKREFVKFSKRFSNTLKDFFREGQAQAVFGLQGHRDCILASQEKTTLIVLAYACREYCENITATETCDWFDVEMSWKVAPSHMKMILGGGNENVHITESQNKAGLEFLISCEARSLYGRSLQ